MSSFQHPIGRGPSIIAMSDQNTAIGAIGAVLGYIGAEGASPTMFERLLWPQRAHAGLTWKSATQLAILGSSGGPVYKAALQVLDSAYSHGLLRGAGLGHMLGSAFFPQSESVYVLHSTDNQLEGHTEAARNCLWQRVSMLLPSCSPASAQDTHHTMERGLIHIQASSRAQVSVHHITLTVCDLPTGVEAVLETTADCQHLSNISRTLCGLVASELSGIVLTVLLAALCRSWLALLWACPLAIRVVSALMAVEREPLSLEHPTGSEQYLAGPQDFEVQLPAEDGVFLVITGPPYLVLQFLRHYGHPKRCRNREIAQLTLVLALALLFPIGLVLSVTIMPNTMQYFWLSHQMYLVVAMYISRYLSPELRASTEELIAKQLARNPNGAYLWASRSTSAKRVVKAEVHTTSHSRYGHAKSYVKDLLARPKSCVKSDSQQSDNLTSERKLATG